MKNKTASRLTAWICILATICLCASQSLLSAGAVYWGAYTQYDGSVIWEYGMYPQTKVTDRNLVSTLDARAADWQAYDCYAENQKANLMRYCDVTYGDEMYRGVRILAYRPMRTSLAAQAKNSFQTTNGYYTGTNYWFRYEPIRWRVIDPSTGALFSDKILDAQPYNNRVIQKYSSLTRKTESFSVLGDGSDWTFACQYNCSSLLKWTEEQFHTTAFSQWEKDGIQSSTSVPNVSILNQMSESVQNYYMFDVYTSWEVLPSLSFLCYSNFGFKKSSAKDPMRQGEGTDYAKCMGLCVPDRDGNTKYSDYYMNGYAMRSDCASCVINTGEITGVQVDTILGIRPMMGVNIRYSDPIDVGQGFSVQYLKTSVGEANVEMTAIADDRITSIVVEQPDYKQQKRFCCEASSYQIRLTKGGNAVDAKLKLCVPQTNLGGTIAVYSVDPDKGSAERVGEMDPETRMCSLPSCGTFVLVREYNCNAYACVLHYKESADFDPKGLDMTQPHASLACDNTDVIALSGTRMTAMKAGTAHVSAYNPVTGEMTRCTVTVKYTFWQTLIRIFLFGWIWY